MRISDWSSDVCSSDLGTNEEIATFCSTTYDVSFPIFSKISVAGEDKHPFYAELIRSAPSAQPDGGAAMREKLSGFGLAPNPAPERSEEHTSELQSLMRISYAVFCLKKNTTNKTRQIHHTTLKY